MKTIATLTLACSLALHVHAANAEQTAANAELKSLKKIVIALKPDKNPDQMIEEKGSLEKHLSEKLKLPVEVITPLSAAVIMEGFANGTIDLGYLSASEMVRLKDNKAGKLLLAGQIGDNTHYESYWLCLKDKPYTSVADLKGKKAAFASKTSTSGYFIPLWDLRKQGLISDKGDAQEFFGEGNVWFGTGYVSAVERVLNGDVEAAAVSDYVFLKDKHLSAEQRAVLKVLDTQGPVPTHVIAVRETLHESVSSLLRESLLELNEPAYHTLRDKLFTSRLVQVDDAAHLDSLREALKFAAQSN